MAVHRWVQELVGVEASCLGVVSLNIRANGQGLVESRMLAPSIFLALAVPVALDGER
jgi:hypothetical protein